MKALARHPSRRFESAAEMVAALADALDEPTRASARRRTVEASVLAAAMGFALVFLFGQLRPHLARLPEHVPWLRAGQGAPTPRGGSDSTASRRPPLRVVLPSQTDTPDEP
jgi:serine/threonine-protein kinase